MARIALVVVVLSACGVAVWFGTSRAAGADAAPTVLHVGDTVQDLRHERRLRGCATWRRDDDRMPAGPQGRRDVRDVDRAHDRSRRPLQDGDGRADGLPGEAARPSSDDVQVRRLCA